MLQVFYSVKSLQQYLKCKKKSKIKQYKSSQLLVSHLFNPQYIFKSQLC